MLKKSKKQLLFLLLVLFFSTFLSANTTDKKNILILHSYHSGMTWIENINKSIKDILKPNLNNFVLYTEYMDTKRHNSKEYYDSLKHIYLKKYKNKKFDMVLSSDNNAFDFLLENKKDIFNDTPVVFCGVNGFDKSMLKDVSNFTGVAEQFSDKETIDTILKVHKDVKNIYIINDYLPTGRAWEKDMRKSLKKYENKVNIIYSENLNLDELKIKINSLKKDTVILLGVYFADKDKNYITYEKVGNYLLKNSKAPVYCLLNFNISSNIIGGKVIGGYSQGEAMSKMAHRILNGQNIKDVRVVYSQANEYVFNYKGIERYNIDESLLPKDSKIINKPYSLYEEYKSILITLIVILLITIFIFIIVLIYLKYNNPKWIKKDDVIISIIRFTPILIIPIIILSIIWFFIYSSNANFLNNQEVEKKNYIEHMKQLSKREVDRYIEISNSLLKFNSLDNIEKDLVEISKNIKYGKRCYTFIINSEGYVVSHIDKKLEHQNFFDGKHEDGKNVFLKLKNRVKTDTKGFVEYKWFNPNSKLKEDKITYVNYIPKLKWYVASGVYLDEIDRIIENKIEKERFFDDKNISIILLSFFILLVVSFAVSIFLSMIIKKAFANYKKNILEEVNRSKIIQKAKDEFETIFKYAQDGILITDLKGNITKFNLAFKNLTRFNNNELKNKNFNDFIVVEEDENIDELYLKKVKIEGHIDHFEKNIIISDNKIITIYISISLLPNKESLLMIIKDASSIKILEEQSKSAAMGEMIGNIAHQWRQPLSVISTGATGLKMGKTFNTLKDDFFFQVCDSINDNAQYLSKTIDDFRNFIKGDREIVKFNLKENIDSFLTLVDGSIKNNEIELILDIDSGIDIEGYPNELKQCFINIFNNSKDALKDIENNRFIFISAFVSGNQVVIIFKDNANGIPVKVLPHIFEPYFTTKHKSKGTGLGLSMTYNLIVKGMNGLIEANNVLYEYDNIVHTGAEFKIVLQK